MVICFIQNVENTTLKAIISPVFILKKKRPGGETFFEAAELSSSDQRKKIFCFFFFHLYSCFFSTNPHITEFPNPQNLKCPQFSRCYELPRLELGLKDHGPRVRARSRTAIADCNVSHDKRCGNC